MYSRSSQENYMQLKRKKRPELPTFDEFIEKMRGESDVARLNPLEISIESEESIRPFFEDPFEHFSSRSESLEETKEYDPYNPNLLN